MSQKLPISDYRCFFCAVRSFEKLLEKENIPIAAKNNFIIDMIELYSKHHDKLSAPEFSRDLHHILKSYTGNHDPYRSEKLLSNKLALEMAQGMQEMIDRSDDPFMVALRLAIAGNVIDFAANHSFDLKRTIEKSLTSGFAIDHSEQLKSAVMNADTILYLGDNAGEIVFDKLFIKAMLHNNVTYAVRGMPVINDVTVEDAEFTGMKEVAEVISNGYDAPSTIIGKSSDEFRKRFNDADLIIAKGQGNLEGLYDLNDKRIFFLLLVKCDVISDFLRIEKNSFVVLNLSYLKKVIQKVAGI